MSDTGSPLSSTTSMGNDGSTVHTARDDDIAVCPDCGIECPPEWGLFDYFDHLAAHDG